MLSVLMLAISTESGMGLLRTRKGPLSFARASHVDGSVPAVEVILLVWAWISGCEGRVVLG